MEGIIPVPGHLITLFWLPLARTWYSGTYIQTHEEIIKNVKCVVCREIYLQSLLPPGLSPVMNSSIARAAESGSEEDLDWSVPLDLQTLSSWEVAWEKRCCSANLSPSIF